MQFVSDFILPIQVLLLNSIVERCILFFENEHARSRS